MENNLLIESLYHRPRIFRYIWVLSLSMVGLLLPPGTALSEIRFQEVTGTAGIAYTGQSYGVSWGDFNSDGLPDAWVSNHLQEPDLYRNNGDGTFTDILPGIWSSNPTDDTHGGTWADFDNDGDQDLINLVGAQGGVGEGSNQLLVNQGGVLVDMAATLGVDYPLARGRTALWLDWNHDGLLDVVLSSNRRPDGQAPSSFFEQIGGGFQNVNDAVGFDAAARSNFSQLSDFDGDGIMDLIVHGEVYPQHVYDITQQPFQDISSILGLIPRTTNVWDAAIADFNGDLRTDIFLTRVFDGRVTSDLLQDDATTTKVRLLASRDEKGISFQSAGDATFDLYQTKKSEIFIGALGQNPSGTSFTLSAGDTSVWGTKSHVPGVDAGTYIGYDPNTQVWQLLLSNPVADAMNGIVQTVTPATGLTAIGFDPEAPPLNDRLLVQTAGTFEDQTVVAGLDNPTSCYSVAAGDLDNDMDVDLYLVCNRPTANLPNILYENLGNGTFVAVADAGGASGSMFGRGENVALADYDGDGFLDLFVTNGMFNDPFNVGPQQLFRNQGNANHWIEIDLEGSVSNRDGIGTQILVTAGGVTQLRERNGGVHRHAQNHKRIHFGLGSNTDIDEVQVRWPSGIVQRLASVSADQVLAILENALSIEDVVIDERAGAATFNVTLPQPSTQTITVAYTTVGGTAVSGNDFVATSGQLVFMPGETRQTISVSIVQDSIDESDETFQVTLTNAVGAAISDGSASGTITRFSTWFREVTQKAGLFHSGQTYGGAWGDFNGDGWPDLFVGNHQEAPSLYLNQGDGTFIDKAAEILPQYAELHDLHGAAWADFDNDGDQDLVQVAGFRFEPGGENFLYVNDAGILIDHAPALGVAFPEQLARTPLWIDWNRDGLLDLMISNDLNQPQDPVSVLLTQAGTDFEDAKSTSGLAVVGQSLFSVLSDLTGDGEMDLIVQESPGPLRIYDIANAPFEDITATLNIPATDRIMDLVAGDFNGDFRSDLFVVRGETAGAGLKRESATRLSARLLFTGQEEGFSFQSSGDVTFTLYGPDIQPLLTREIYIGSGGYNPTAVPTFSLSPSDNSNLGVTQWDPGVNDGVRIGYDAGTQTWTVLYTGGRRLQLNAIIEASNGLSGDMPIGFDRVLTSFANRLFVQNNTGYSDESDISGLGSMTNCTSAAAADFDNDMDLDIYVVCSGILDNQPNLYYENMGDGTFVTVQQGAGAMGSTIGRGDSVVVADYDQDGFLDLFIDNGMSLGALTPFNGPHQLFRNLGNDNHWLEIDLVGVESNRDAVGAMIWITTPDGKIQMREQSGGVHRASQNHQRIHVGLGSNTTVNNVKIEWPNGLIQKINNVDVDQVLRMVEGMTSNRPPVISGAPATMVAEGEVYSFIPLSTDPDVGDTLLFSVVDKPGWADFDPLTGKLSGVPGGGDIGVTSNIVISVNDQNGEANSVVSLPAFDIEVTGINRAPSVSSGGIILFQNTVGTVQLVVRDPDAGDTHTFAVTQSDSLGGMLSLGPTGFLSYDATGASPGTENIEVTVTDQGGASAKLSVPITVNMAGEVDSNADGVTDIQATALGLDPDDADGDSDGDGIPDANEIGDPDPAKASDRDGDGVIDALEVGDKADDASIASGISFDGVSVEIQGGGQLLSKVSSIQVIDGPTGISFPFGMISYTITSSPGGSVTIRMAFSDPLPSTMAMYKVDSSGAFAELPNSVWNRVDSTTVDITLKDGDPVMDLDGVVNGEIVDPIAPADIGAIDTNASTSGNGGGGGCMLKSGTSRDPLFPLLMFISFSYLLYSRSRFRGCRQTDS